MVDVGVKDFGDEHDFVKSLTRNEANQHRILSLCRALAALRCQLKFTHGQIQRRCLGNCVVAGQGVPSRHVHLQSVGRVQLHFQ